MSISTFLNQKTAGLAILLGFSSLALTTPSHAAILNGGFEDNLTDWTSIGDVSTQTDDFDATPTQGNSQALLTTASSTFVDDSTGTFNFSGNEPATVGTAGGLEDFLGLPLGSLPGSDSFFNFPFEGSALKQTFSAQAGDVLSFDWNFLTNDDPSNQDYAFVVLDNLSKLAQTTDNLNSSSTVFSQETGFQTFSHTFTSASEFSLALGVVDAGDFNNSSALLVDNVTLTTPAAVPEPGSVVGVLLFGALGIKAVKKGQRKM